MTQRSVLAVLVFISVAIAQAPPTGAPGLIGMPPNEPPPQPPAPKTATFHVTGVSEKPSELSIEATDIYASGF